MHRGNIILFCICNKCFLQISSNSCILFSMEKFFTYRKVDSLPLLLPEKQIWSRLGRNRFLSQISPEQEIGLKLLMHKAFTCCAPCGVWKMLKIVTRSPQSVTLAGNWVLESAAFAEFVGNSPFLWLGAVTVGNGITAAANQAEDLQQAAVFDAVGSECADQAVGLLQELAARELLRSNLSMGKPRFSPGYGNLSLHVQKRIFEELSLHELNMTLTDSCIMQPEKSVTAFAVVNGDNFKTP